MNSKSDAELVEIYRVSIREIYAYCLRRLFVKDLAEDATSAVFLRLVEKYPLLRGKSRPEIRAWLYGIASNVVASFLRGARRQKQISQALAEIGQDSSGQESPGLERLDWPILYAAIRELSERQQALIVLRYFQGFETKAIAEAMGMVHATVRGELLRTVAALRQKLLRLQGRP